MFQTAQGMLDLFQHVRPDDGGDLFHDGLLQ
jgi:hypothetical protein